MKRMRAIRAIQWTAVFLLAAVQPLAGAADDEAKTTFVKVGEPAPDFVCRTLVGEDFSLSKQKGSVVMINFFAKIKLSSVGYSEPAFQEILRTLQKELDQ